MRSMREEYSQFCLSTNLRDSEKVVMQWPPRLRIHDIEVVKNITYVQQFDPFVD